MLLYTLTIETVGEGTVDLSPPGPIYDYGTEVTLTAQPADHWHFVEWTGDVTETENPTTVTMDADKSVTANFAIDTYTLTIIVVGVGTVEQSPPGPIYDYGTEVTLTALPGTGYTFSGWSGDVGSMENPLAVVMDEDKTIIVTFTPGVTVLAPNGGEIFPVDSELEIRWEVAEGVDSVTVDVSLSRHGGGGPWEPLATNLPNTGAFAWTADEPASDSCFIAVTVHDLFSSSGSDASDDAFRIISTESVVETPVTAFGLESVWPNPASGPAQLRFAVPREAPLRLSVIDVQGREVTVLAEGVQSAGYHTIEWNGRTDRGAAAPGIYLVRLVTPTGTFVRRLAIVR